MNRPVTSTNIYHSRFKTVQLQRQIKRHFNLHKIILTHFNYINIQLFM